MKHRPTYTAQDMARALHVSGENVAKTVLVRAGADYILLILPATHRVDLERVRQILRAPYVEVASEDECGALFPDCDLGALPPFGSRYGLKTLVDFALAADRDIVFEGNRHDLAFKMRFTDYEVLERPMLGRFSFHS